MLGEWFNVRGAAEAGSALADQVAQRWLSGAAGSRPGQPPAASQEFRHLAAREFSRVRLNFFTRAKLASSFKWRLLDKGVDKGLAEEITQALIVHLMFDSGSAAAVSAARAPTRGSVVEQATPEPAAAGKFKQLMTRGEECFVRGEYSQALDLYKQAAALKPGSAEAQNNVGATLCKLMRHIEAEPHLRRALKIRPKYPEALSALGAVLQGQGKLVESEQTVRRALTLRPNDADARCVLGTTLSLQARAGEARVQFEKALRAAPQHVDSMLGIAQVAATEGGFDEAEVRYKRVLDMEGASAATRAFALAAIAGLRRMSTADSPWLDQAQSLAASGVEPAEESALRFAIGKYFDELGDYNRAFESYRRANALSKELALPYRRDAHIEFVDELVRVYTRETTAAIDVGASDSETPVFVIGMPRSGTSLAEQIIASHPAAHGAGELEFWTLASRKLDANLRKNAIDAPTRQKLAAEYLRVLAEHSSAATRIVDKAPVNLNYLGLIHSVFPRARFIHMRRDPIDTCLSCYFQPFLQAQNFAMDLSDLEHYYRQQHRLMAHWKAILPPGTLLDVPYEALVTDQLKWTQNILEFLGLEWHQRCLEFHNTQRDVATSSRWQVRQQMYNSSVDRWRNYEKFVGPLLNLRKLDV
jgi:tetratricopeptide (TPR) repeat protein